MTARASLWLESFPRLACPRTFHVDLPITRSVEQTTQDGMVRGSSILAGACLSSLLLASTATAAFIPHADLSGMSFTGRAISYLTLRPSADVSSPFSLLPCLLVASSRRLSTRRAVRMNNKDISHLKKYCETVYQTKRRPTRTVWAGKVRTGRRGERERGLALCRRLTGTADLMPEHLLFT